ncbi:hypothetical protein [Desulfosporosinus hippei]|uniref:MerR HTH family regulatory protein n=1 Tax=Desulfosporosinus hippei DSM 8344 TaxID=1121419 RepID=A0A1G8CG34_9FIRM|nr:hypothetical protein [Desulfosporosinus hippei]SDH44348.1 hypothetical protein SAMN05443529_11390 [Desulfosporosinus hippei DSM 8344]
MREFDSQVMYTAGDVALLINRSRQTILAWDALSDFWEQEHGVRFTPKPVRDNGQRLYSKTQVREIKKFVDSKKSGIMAKAKREMEEKKKGKMSKENKQNWALDRK